MAFTPKQLRGAPRETTAGHHSNRHRRLSDTPSVDVHARGRSPGLRVATSIRLPKARVPQWLLRTNARRLQLRGQLRIFAIIMITPDSRLSLPLLRIEGTSNTRYSRACEKSVNNYDRL